MIYARQRPNPIGSALFWLWISSLGLFGTVVVRLRDTAPPPPLPGLLLMLAACGGLSFWAFRFARRGPHEFWIGNGELRWRRGRRSGTLALRDVAHFALQVRSYGGLVAHSEALLAAHLADGREMVLGTAFGMFVPTELERLAARLEERRTGDRRDAAAQPRP